MAGQVNNSNEAIDYNKIKNKPTKVSDFTNDADYQSGGISLFSTLFKSNSRTCKNK